MTDNIANKQTVNRKRNAPHNKSTNNNFKKMRYVHELEHPLTTNTNVQNNNKNFEVSTSTNIPEQNNKQQLGLTTNNLKQIRYESELQTELTLNTNIQNKKKNIELSLIPKIPKRILNQSQKITVNKNKNKFNLPTIHEISSDGESSISTNCTIQRLRQQLTGKTNNTITPHLPGINEINCGGNHKNPVHENNFNHVYELKQPLKLHKSNSQLNLPRTHQISNNNEPSTSTNIFANFNELHQELTVKTNNTALNLLPINDITHNTQNSTKTNIFCRKIDDLQQEITINNNQFNFLRGNDITTICTPSSSKNFTHIHDLKKQLTITMDNTFNLPRIHENTYVRENSTNRNGSKKIHCLQKALTINNNNSQLNLPHTHNINTNSEPLMSINTFTHIHELQQPLTLNMNNTTPNLPRTRNTSNIQHLTNRNISNDPLQLRFHSDNNISNNHDNSNNVQHNFNNIPEHYLGNMDVLCIHCKAKHFKQEKVSNRGNSFNDCCSHGQVMLPPLPEPPTILKELFNGTHPLSNHFFNEIRKYNNSFSFASFNANLVQFNNRRPGPFCFKIQGQIYYQINTSLYPPNNELPSFGQLFIVDTNEATECRMDMVSTLNAQILTAIDSAMRQCNVFAQSYQMMKEELDSMTEQNDGIEPELQLLFTLKKGQDQRRYNPQRCNEVAAIFSTTADGEIPESYVTIRNKHTKNLQYVNSMDENVEPWTYPLFYPYGSKGWSDDIKKVGSNRRVTRNAYIKYRMAIRDDTNYILMGRRLFQQWTVDNYVKVEKDKMNFLRNNQTQLRADTYENLLQHLETTAENASTRIGKVVIIPSTYLGSPRNMQQNYQDAMTIVRKFGKPDLFITMTCNPKWREITENLLDGQSASDRPDLVARVFDLKKEELINKIVKNEFFGKVQAYVYVVEYQKRGLPHIHLLVTLKPNSKITTPDIVDKFISAEIPSATENLRLHQIIDANMIHGPCGDWCLDTNGKCSKIYPKQFNDQTNMDEDGYPHYRRKNTEKYRRRDGFEYDNRRVVPHNQELLLILNCHINVEVVTSIKAVKYLYKYIYKGHDAASIVIQEAHSNENQEEGVLQHDEIRNYLETRYISPPEACARILSKNLLGKSHCIYRLPVHLPNQQTITVENMDDENSVRSALSRSTQLTEFFALNERDAKARNYTYSEIPLHYVFQKNKNSANAFTWQERKQHFNTLGRMYSISPTQTELFHLRLLLITVKGPTSFQNLRTVNGILHDNFVSTCLALGLIEDDDEWKNAMHEAEVWMMPRQLRQLFVRILIHCQPIQPEKIWEEFKDALSQDYSRFMSSNMAQRKAYIHINTLLNAENSSIEHFPSMQQITEVENVDDNGILLQEHEKSGREQYEKLNEKQKEIVDIILKTVNEEQTIDNNKWRCFFIDGPGGSGKTFVYTTLIHLLQSHKKRVCTMAFTGIAATLLPNGKTVHRTFKLPIAIYNDSSPTIKAQSKEAEYLKSIDVFFWDEAPMAPRHALQLVDRNLRDIMNNDTPFGGKIMILGGDFRQLLPVKQNAIRSELTNLCIKYSTVWPEFFQFSLTENMRALPHEKEFSAFLLQVGDGTANHSENDLQLPESCIAPPNTDIAEYIYGDVIRNKQFEKLTKTAILSARNVDVDDINRSVVELLDVTTEKIYTSINTVKNCDNCEMAEALLPEYLETLNPPNLPPHELRLRINTVVMLIRNLSINEGLCNGTRLQILELKNHLLKCKVLTGDKCGQIVFINRITLYSDERYPFQFGRRQFPIKIAFAMTINKSQGQTFDKIGIDLRRDVFNHGQFYVALSRVRSWDSLKIFLGDQRQTNVIKNIVFREIYDQ